MSKKTILINSTFNKRMKFSIIIDFCKQSLFAHAFFYLSPPSETFRRNVNLIICRVFVLFQKSNVKINCFDCFTRDFPIVDLLSLFFSFSKFIHLRLELRKTVFSFNSFFFPLRLFLLCFFCGLFHSRIILPLLCNGWIMTPCISKAKKRKNKKNNLLHTCSNLSFVRTKSS